MTTENLKPCSQVPNNKDIYNKTEEIESLKKKLSFYEPPNIEYSNIEEWDTKKTEAYQIIKNGLDEWIIKDNFEYEHMSYQGLTTRQKMNIPYYIKKALKIITKGNNKEWAENISYDIISVIEGFLNVLKKNGIWDLIYSQLDSKKMSNLIYNMIVCQLDNGEHSPCILEDIAVFTCEMCGKKNNYINDDNICLECEEKTLE